MIDHRIISDGPHRLFYGRVLSGAGLIFFTFVAQDPVQVDKRVRTVWETSRKSDAGATFIVAPL